MTPKEAEAIVKAFRTGVLRIKKGVAFAPKIGRVVRGINKKFIEQAAEFAAQVGKLIPGEELAGKTIKKLKGRGKCIIGKTAKKAAKKGAEKVVEKGASSLLKK